MYNTVSREWVAADSISWSSLAKKRKCVSSLIMRFVTCGSMHCKCVKLYLHCAYTPIQLDLIYCFCCEHYSQPCNTIWVRRLVNTSISKSR